MRKLYGIYGAGGFSREVIPLLIHKKDISKEDVCFVVDKEYLPSVQEKLLLLNDEKINDYNILSYDKFRSIETNQKYITIAISDNNIRKEIYEKCSNDNINHFSILSHNSCIMDKVNIGKGSIISPFVTLTSNISIGKSFHANLYSYVAHDCKIGDYVTFAPAVKCNGNVIIEDNVYIGTGAIIKQGTPNNPIIIGKNAVIGAGSFVTKNVESNATVFGNPAKILNKNNIK